MVGVCAPEPVPMADVRASPLPPIAFSLFGVACVILLTPQTQLSNIEEDEPRDKAVGTPTGASTPSDGGCASTPHGTKAPTLTSAGVLELMALQRNLPDEVCCCCCFVLLLCMLQHLRCLLQQQVLGAAPVFAVSLRLCRTS